MATTEIIRIAAVIDGKLVDIEELYIEGRMKQTSYRGTNVDVVWKGQGPAEIVGAEFLNQQKIQHSGMVESTQGQAMGLPTDQRKWTESERKQVQTKLMPTYLKAHVDGKVLNPFSLTAEDPKVVAIKRLEAVVNAPEGMFDSEVVAFVKEELKKLRS